MSVELMREAIKKVYPGETWSKKVKNMKDAQVLAIYTRMLYDGKLK